MEHVEIDNIVEIDIIHLHSIIVHRTLKHLVSSRIHLNIQMISVLPMRNNRITLDKLILIERYWFLLLERLQVSFIRSLGQLDHITTWTLELE